MPDPTLRNAREQIVLTGDVPSPANPPSACRFHTRCWKAQEICSVEEPMLIARPDGRVITRVRLPLRRAAGSRLIVVDRGRLRSSAQSTRFPT